MKEPAAARVPPKLYKIGEVMRYSGLSRQTIHNYTVMGLISEAERTPAGHRLYAEAVFARLARVRALQGSMTLREIKQLLEREDRPGGTSGSERAGPARRAGTSGSERAGPARPADTSGSTRAAIRHPAEKDSSMRPASDEGPSVRRLPVGQRAGVGAIGAFSGAGQARVARTGGGA